MQSRDNNGAVMLFPTPDQAKSALHEVYQRQRAAFDTLSPPDYADRKAALVKLLALLERNRIVIGDALNDDFGARAQPESQMVDVNGSISSIRYIKRHLRKWMRPERRHTSIWFLPGGNAVLRQPVGVVGIMSPWNYPVHLSLAPAAAALAAGNRVMLKMSELVPQTTALLKRLVQENFEADQFCIIDGDASVAAEFAAVPFDHLLFTGSTAVGRKVAEAAAKNLTPVTLELGGKSPAIVDQDYPLARAVERIVWGKLFNAGQTCIAPDYVLVPKGSEQAFADQAIERVGRFYPDIGANPDATSIISDRHYRRLADLVEDARGRGARVVEAPMRVDDAQPRRFPLTLVLDAPADSAVMREEIFGPVLPVVTYSALDDAIRQVNAGPAPLALYYFGNTRARRQQVLAETRSGGVTLNDTLIHYLQDDLPFGGIGDSGQGSYHGREGFDTFSHKKAVFTQRGFGGFTGATLLYPPYGRIAAMLLKTMRGL